MTIPINLHLDKIQYKALGNKVLLREVVRRTLRGLGISETSAEAKRYFAVSVGPKVEGIAVGDEVILGGFQVPILAVPGESDLIVALDTHCFLVKTDSEALQ